MNNYKEEMRIPETTEVKEPGHLNWGDLPDYDSSIGAGYTHGILLTDREREQMILSQEKDRDFQYELLKRADRLNEGKFPFAPDRSEYIY